jgi:hypothetical protein
MDSKGWALGDRLVSGALVALALALGLGLQGCAGQPSGDDSSAIDSGAVARDSSSDSTLGMPNVLDSSLGSADSGTRADTAVSDTGTPGLDTGAPPADSGSPTDSGALADGGTADSDSADGGSNAEAGQDSATAAGDCGTTPTLHPGSGTSLYCPFGPGGTAIECVSGSQYCCISGKVGGAYPPSDCETISAAGCTVGLTADSGSAQIQCEDPATDCPAGNVCCAAPATVVIAPGCSYERLYDLQYTTCEQGATCKAGEIQVCATAAECPAGKTCTPFKATLDLGYCK